MSASAIVRSGPVRAAGSGTSARGAYTEASISSTVGSGLACANPTARSSSTSTVSSSSLSRIAVASFRSFRWVAKRAIGSRSIHSRSSAFVR